MADHPIHTTTPAERIHYLDNLRVWAMLLGVVLHAGLSFAIPAQTVWLATDTQGSVLIDISIWFIHLFRMGLFYLLSGYFGALLVERKGVRSFLINRLVRVAMPLVLFWPFLMGAMVMVIILAVGMDYEKRGMMRLIEAAWESGAGADSSDDELGWMHLWFLYYLLLFSLIGATCSQWCKVKFDWLFNRAWLLALLPLALIPSVWIASVPIPPAEPFIPLLWPFGFYGLFYWGGWQLYGRERLLQSMLPYSWAILVGSLVLFVPYYWCLPVLDLETAMRRTTVLEPWALALESVLTAYLSVSLSITALLFGQRYLAAHSPAMRFVSDASYWIYLVHLPIVLLLQTIIVPWQVNVWIKFSGTVLVTFVLCMATYVVFVRYTPIGWMLNGKRKFP